MAIDLRVIKLGQESRQYLDAISDASLLLLSLYVASHQSPFVPVSVYINESATARNCGFD